jgi:hypothetical protein
MAKKKNTTKKEESTLSIDRINKIIEGASKTDVSKDALGKLLLNHAYKMMGVTKKPLGGMLLNAGLELIPALIKDYKESQKHSTDFIDPAFMDTTSFMEYGGPLDEIYKGIKKFRPDLDDENATIYAKSILDTAIDNNLDPKSLAAQIAQESAFRADAQSPTGPKGLAQLTQHMAKKYGLNTKDVDERLDPKKSIDTMGKIMADNILKNVRDGYGEDMSLARMRYSEGGPRMKQMLKSGELTDQAATYSKMIEKKKAQMFENLDPIEFTYAGGDLPQAEVTAKRMKSGGTFDSSTYRKGGFIGDDEQQFKQYNFPSHEQGGGMIDINLNPTDATPVAELEKNETSYRMGGQPPYIYSDSLIDHETNGMTFADVSKKIAAKYRRGTDIDKVSKQLEMKNLADRNTAERERVELFDNNLMGDFELPEFERGWQSEKDPYGYITYDNRLNLSKDGYILGKDGNIVPGIETNKDGTTSANPGFTDLTEETNTNSPFNYNIPAVAAKATAFAANLVDALGKPEQEKLQLNPYEQDVVSLMENRNIDLTPLLNEINLGASASIDNARNVAGNAGQFSALANKIFAGAGRASSNVKMQQEQMNNEYRAQEAATKAGLGTEKRSEFIRQQDVQSRNDASQRNLVRKTMSDLSQIGSEFNKYQYVKEQIANRKDISDKVIKEGVALLKGRYSDFGLSDEFIQKIESGEYNGASDLIVFLKAVAKAEEKDKNKE